MKYVDQKNYEKIMNDKDSKVTKNYFDVLDVFTEKIGGINPDDLSRLSVLCSLAVSHSKA